LKPLDGEERVKLRNAFDSAAGIAHVFRHRQPLAQLLSLPGTARVLLCPPSPHRALEEYARFLDALLHRLRPEFTPSSPTRALIEIGSREPPRNIHARSHRIRKLRRSPAKVVSRAGRPICPPAFPGTGWDGADRGLWDRNLESITVLYRAIRRHVWRTLVGVHQVCATGAASELDHDTEGELVSTFCPVASAYLRWRLYWEGMRVPADLFRPPRHIPLGIFSWLCDGAPVAAESWGLRDHEWLVGRVFAMDCINSFAAWSDHCRTHLSATTRWRRADAGGYGLTYWAATKPDRVSALLRMFLEVRDVYKRQTQRREPESTHWSGNTAQRRHRRQA